MPADSAAGYALAIHETFWNSISKNRRAEYVGVFVARARRAGMGNPELGKELVRAFGAEVAYFGAAASILVGYEAYSRSTFHWAGPNWYFVPNQTERPRWLKELVDEEEEDGADANPEKEHDRAKSSALTEQALRRARHRTGAPLVDKEAHQAD